MKYKIRVLIFTLLLVLILSSCKSSNPLDPKKPVTLTIWHNYGGQMKNLMDEMIDEFNRTIGADKGIIASVTSISGSKTLHDKLISAANDDPGAPELPDISVVYPKTAIVLAEKELLSDISEQFDEKELSAYVPQFLQEGTLHGRLFVFPVAKSTEAMFVNKTIFDRFSAGTGASYDDLRTFEGIIQTSDKYYEWTDSRTPDVPNDGKSFYMPDSVFNTALIGMAQLGENFIESNELNTSSETYKKIWNSYFPPAVKGSVAIFDGYSTDLFKTGDLVCSIGSTAGVLFYPDTVTYTDNIKENAEYAILPYPVFEGGKRVALQRGGGMCIIRSTVQKETAAAIFLKWFTSPEKNLYFTASSGYLPVTKEAFESTINNHQLENIENVNITNLFKIVTSMYEEYDFFIPPLVENYDELQDEYEKSIKKIAKDYKAEFYASTSSDKNTTIEEVSTNALKNFIK